LLLFKYTNYGLFVTIEMTEQDTKQFWIVIYFIYYRACAIIQPHWNCAILLYIWLWFI